jgi:hypothetical protein
MRTNIFARWKAAAYVAIALTTLLLKTGYAYAAVQPAVEARIQVVAQSTSANNTAHWLTPVGATISGSCNGAIYMEYIDKEMFAVALTAQANKLEVELYYDNSAASKTIYYGYSTPSFTTTCKLIAINLKYVE